ncbi:CRISPR-associated protein Csm3 [Romeria aff. gracilis LEGE 07310]|uniref:CRISPR-associated protein Csm3 n=1 Tax=Vasconcelosia minhoensis LEGE 07310 TaxID=915328 RepID=A0A8J7ARB3_9CYAN|nr:RAMP superfamily CRISPR-associated protein [Romeria gracilis]MBE9079036.1 CRISPR-associated protein Csm3 [Romeria aff. gracilis LEGE 07310]
MVQLRDLLQTTGDSIALTARVDSALCVGAGGSSGSLADKPIIRTASGQLLIPGSQLKGRLRHECEKLARGLSWPICGAPAPETMCPQIGLSNSDFQRRGYNIGRQFADGRQQYHCLTCQMFGNPALPSRVMVDDLICDIEPDTLPEVLRPGVTINRRRQTAEDQKLYFLETSPVNVALPFTGQIHFEADCPDHAKVLILAALQHIHALGGSKSAGLGWLRWEYDLLIDARSWDLLKAEDS